MPTLKTLAAIAAIILAAVAVLSALVAGFSAPAWVLPVAVLLLAVVVVV